jgi:hypothetical protein
MEKLYGKAIITLDPKATSLLYCGPHTRMVVLHADDCADVARDLAKRWQRKQPVPCLILVSKNDLRLRDVTSMPFSDSDAELTDDMVPDALIETMATALETFGKAKLKNPLVKAKMREAIDRDSGKLVGRSVFCQHCGADALGNMKALKQLDTDDGQLMTLFCNVCKKSSLLLWKGEAEAYWVQAGTP